VIYDGPIDLPGRFVARKWLLDRPTSELLQSRALDDLRAKSPAGLTRPSHLAMGRGP
jgi:hypothetical protein